LAQAGIKVVWQDCSAGEVGDCARELGTGEFWLHVATWKPASASAWELGFTAVDPDSETGGSVAGVYYPMVKELAVKSAIEEAAILGAALAHEIGHLLGVDHSPTGVMCWQLNRQRMVEMNQGGLLFARNQAARMQAEVIRRTRVRRASAGIEHE
jgi:hypothetical protein